MNGEPRAKDILKELPLRAVVGDRLCRRVGARGWMPPRFATGRKIYARYGIPDPWDPDAPTTGGLGLGEVGVAAPKREPAPHATPKAPASSGPKLPNVPQAQTRVPGQPEPTPREGKAAPQIGEMRRDDTAQLRAAGEAKVKAEIRAKAEQRRKEREDASSTPKHALARLPVRPEVAGGGAGASVPVRAPPPQFGPPKVHAPSAMSARSNSSEPSSQQPRPGRLMFNQRRLLDEGPEELPLLETAPQAGVRSAGVADLFGLSGGTIDDDEPRASVSVRWEAPVDVGPPPVAAPTPAPTPNPTVAVPKPAPTPSPVAAAPKPSPAPGPSFAAPRPAPTPGPVSSSPNPVASVPKPTPTPSSPASAPSRPAEPKPPARAAPPRGSGGLDDLFGMGATEGRVRIPKKTDGEAPRRPMVTSAEDLAKSAVDRRPPPAKPPVVVPSPSGSGATPEPEPED